MALSPRYTVKTPGFVEDDPGPITPTGGNAIQLGKLWGLCNPYSVSIIWEFEDDADDDSYGGWCRIRRLGTTTWYHGPDFKRAETSAPVNGTSFKAYVTKIWGLCGNTTYEVECTVNDPDGGSETRTTTFTTRWPPRIPSDDGDAHHVHNQTDLTTAYNNSNGGEPIYLYADGSPYNTPATGGRLQNGSYGNPHYITAAPGETAILDQLSVQDTGNQHIWLDRLTMTFRIHSQKVSTYAGEGDGMIVTRISNLNNSTGVPLYVYFQDVWVSDCQFGRDDIATGRVIEHAAVSQNVHIGFTRLTTGFDAFSKGGTGDMPDHMNVDWTFSAVDVMGDDTFEMDNALHGHIACYCVCGPSLGKTGYSHQGQLMGWGYSHHVQMTGLRYGLDTGEGPSNIKHQFKLEHNQALMWNVNHTWIVGTNSNNKGKNERVLFGKINGATLDPEGAVFANVAWGDEETIQAGLGGVSITVPGDPLFSNSRLIAGNLYDATDPWDGLTLAQMQAEGHDLDSVITDLSVAFDNYPADVDVGTALHMFPVAGGAADGSGNTGAGVNGMQPFIGPWHGAFPDTGAFQRLIDWHAGPRQFTNFAGDQVNQGYALPATYSLRDESTATDSQYTALGLPSSVDPFGYTRLLMDKDGPTTPTAAAVVNFRLVNEVDVWDEYLSFLDAEHIPSKTIVRKWRLEGGDGFGYIRHGLGVTQLTSGANTIILICAIEDGGLCEITWGVPTATLSTTDILERAAWLLGYSVFSEHGEVEQGAMPPVGGGNLTTIYNETKRKALAGEVDWVSDDIRARLVMTNTTAGTDNDGVVNLDDITTLDEMDGANYARVTLTGKTVAEDSPNNLGEWSATNALFTNLGAGTRDVEGVLLYKHIDGMAANDQALAFLKFDPVVAPTGNSISVNLTERLSVA